MEKVWAVCSVCLILMSRVSAEMVFASEQEYYEATDEIITATRAELAQMIIAKDAAWEKVAELEDKLSDMNDDFNSLVRDHERTVEELTTKTQDYDELYKRTMDTLSEIESSVKEIRRDMK